MIWIYISFAAAVSAALIAARSRYETHHFRLKEYVIETEYVTGEVRIGFISDLHNCSYTNGGRTIADAVSGSGCDLLIIGGDMIVGRRITGEKEPEEFYGCAAEFLKSISGHLPIYYVYGNHETRMKNIREKNPVYDKYLESIKELDIEFINDRTAVWQDEEKINTLIITGLEIDEKAYGKGGYAVKREAFATEAAEGFRLLAAHSPEFFDSYADENVQLILCGHNHGGTVRLPFAGGVISRDFKLFPKYAYGKYEKNGKTMILTSGLGDHTIHFRLFNMPEIVVIKLVQKSV